MAETVKIKNSKEDQCIVLEALAGDMIKFSRGFYSHWAIYIGNDTVIHRWGENDGIGQSVGVSGNLLTIYGVQFNKAQICESKISDVMKYGGTGRVDNYLDLQKKPLPTHVILDRAQSALGKQGYNLLYSNCEHFATDCRYGQANCRQVQIALIASVATGAFMAVITFAAAHFLSSSSPNDEEEKENDIKEIQIKM